MQGRGINKTSHLVNIAKKRETEQSRALPKLYEVRRMYRLSIVYLSYIYRVSIVYLSCIYRVSIVFIGFKVSAEWLSFMRECLFLVQDNYP